MLTKKYLRTALPSRCTVTLGMPFPFTSSGSWTANLDWWNSYKAERYARTKPASFENRHYLQLSKESTSMAGHWAGSSQTTIAFIMEVGNLEVGDPKERSILYKFCLVDGYESELPAVINLIMRDYWKRAWIIQEIVGYVKPPFTANSKCWNRRIR